MENASKALIIAGAILLSILIISLGLMVYNQAKETIGSVNLSQQEIEAFNSKFTAYENVSVSGVQVNALIQTVIASKQQAIQDNTNAYVNIQFPTVTDGTNLFVGVNASNTVVYAESATCTSADGVRDLSSASSTSTTKSLKVATGKKYSVTFAYKNARVAGIYVK